MDSLLILVVAVCAVMATGAAIHDANQGVSNPLQQRVETGVKSVVHWFGTVTATPSKHSTSSPPPTDAHASDSATVQSLEKQLFGQQALVPTFGAVLP